MKAWKLSLGAALCIGLLYSVGFMGCNEEDKSIPAIEEACEDGIDNDLDGCIDVADADCGGIEADCHDGLDNDCDDCADDLDLDCQGGFCFITAVN